jgi:uncharacterized protein YeaO (DUF488 family)
MVTHDSHEESLRAVYGAHDEEHNNAVALKGYLERRSRG